MECSITVITPDFGSGNTSSILVIPTTKKYIRGGIGRHDSLRSYSLTRSQFESERMYKYREVEKRITRQAHNLKIARSSRASATRKNRSLKLR